MPHMPQTTYTARQIRTHAVEHRVRTYPKNDKPCPQSTIRRGVLEYDGHILDEYGRNCFLRRRIFAGMELLCLREDYRRAFGAVGHRRRLCKGGNKLGGNNS